jgi:hypothetical protein
MLFTENAANSSLLDRLALTALPERQKRDIALDLAVQS